MIKVLVAASLLLTLAACGSTGAEPRPAADRPLPFAPPPPPMQGEGVACAADVKQCADGSYVSRNPANGCAFDACPGARKQ